MLRKIKAEQAWFYEMLENKSVFIE